MEKQKTHFGFNEMVEGLGRLGLEKGDTVLAQGSFVPFRRIEGGPKTIIQALLHILLPNGTLIMPTFNFIDFGQNKFYSKRNTKPQTGILSELLIDWPGSRRIYHPFHGFALLGGKADELSRTVKNENSFAENSLFGVLHHLNAKLMLLGVNYNTGFTFFHYIEERVGVPYRKYLKLSGKVEELDGSIQEITMPYYGRKSLDIKKNINKIESLLEDPNQPNIVQTTKIDLGTIKVMRAKDVYDKVAPALKKNPSLVLADNND